MSKLALAVLNEKNEIERFEEIDMSWVDQFNEEFKKSEVPFKEKVYQEELIEMTSFAILNGMVMTENDEEFKVNREPLKATLRKLFEYEQEN